MGMDIQNQEKAFNPRLREGGDGDVFEEDFSKYLSIHASAKEATMNNAVYLICGTFNPRLREGGDP